MRRTTMAKDIYIVGRLIVDLAGVPQLDARTDRASGQFYLGIHVEMSLRRSIPFNRLAGLIDSFDWQRPWGDSAAKRAGKS